ncbi:MAG: hypothetical protein CME71_07725 [Halobacteriovorax sp.]|nr:hypothetical protein [Halobacteriovorax sp.]|tara:strand:- start:1577 stop:2737 length:1161 start_codon:yes stop_codon:yes gene_type:complete
MNRSTLLLFLSLLFSCQRALAFEKYFQGAYLNILSEKIHTLSVKMGPNTLFKGDQIIKKLCPVPKKECDIKLDEYYFLTELKDKSCYSKKKDETCIISGYIVAQLLKERLLKKMPIEGYKTDTRSLSSVGYKWGRLYNREGDFNTLTGSKRAGSYYSPGFPLIFGQTSIVEGKYKRDEWGNIEKPRGLKIINPFENDSLEMWYQSEWVYDNIYPVDKGGFTLKKEFDCSKIKINTKDYKYFDFKDDSTNFDITKINTICHELTYKIFKSENGVLYTYIKSNFYDSEFEHSPEYITEETRDTNIGIPAAEYQKLPSVVAAFEERELFPDPQNPEKYINYVLFQEIENSDNEEQKWNKSRGFRFLRHFPLKDADQGKLRKIKPVLEFH